MNFYFWCMYIVSLLDGNVVVSETQYFAPKDCFKLNEPLQEGIIIFFYLWFTFHLS